MENSFQNRIFNNKNNNSHTENREINKKLVSMHKNLTQSFSKIKEEMEDHLGSINENTQEIQETQEILNNINYKIEKLQERIDEIQLIFSHVKPEQNISINLNINEQKLFLFLYTYEKGFLSIKSISERLNFSEKFIEELLLTLKDKGIPIIEQRIDETDEKLFYKLDEVFRTRQAKENIIQIDSAVTIQHENKLLNRFF